MTARITNIKTYLPKKIITNHNLKQHINTSNK